MLKYTVSTIVDNFLPLTKKNYLPKSYLTTMVIVKVPVLLDASLLRPKKRSHLESFKFIVDFKSTKYKWPRSSLWAFFITSTSCRTDAENDSTVFKLFNIRKVLKKFQSCSGQCLLLHGELMHDHDKRTKNSFLNLIIRL